MPFVLFFFCCKFKIPSKVDYFDYHLPTLHLLHNSEFQIPKFVVQISKFGIQNSEFRSSMEMKSEPFGPSYKTDNRELNN